MGFLRRNRSVFISFSVFLLALLWAVGGRSLQEVGGPAAATGCGDQQLDRRPRGAAAVDTLIATYQDRIKRCPSDQLAYAQLGAAYLQKARETGDPTYYAKADQVVTAAIEQNPDNILVLETQTMLALSRHQFREALTLAERILALSPNRPEAYGLLSDAQVELGQYSQAITSVQRMVDLRPNLSSYSRVSYLRELHGDLPGAIAAMQQAVEARGPHAESTSWTLVQLGHLYFNSGAPADAERHYKQALSLFPSSMHAQAGLAKIAAVRGDYDQAREIYRQVTQHVPLPEYVIALGEVSLAMGDATEAERQFDLVAAIDALQQANGMATDLEMALFIANHGDPQEAVRRARMAYQERPGIYAADVLAWSLSQAGEQREAQRYMDEALRLGTKDSMLWYHAGMIAYRSGDLAEARRWLLAALALNPHFSPLYADMARQTLAEIQGD